MSKKDIIDPYRTIKVLILEDVPEDAKLVQHELEKAGYIVSAKVVDDETSFTLAIMHFFPDIILADYALPSFSGLDALYIAREKSPNTPFVFVTGAIGEEIAAETIINGASGFVLKANLPKLAQVVGTIFRNQGGWRNKRLEYTNKRIQARIEANLEALNRIHKFIEKSSQTDPDWEDALREVERLKEDITQRNGTPSKKDQS